MSIGSLPRAPGGGASATCLKEHNDLSLLQLKDSFIFSNISIFSYKTISKVISDFLNSVSRKFQIISS